MGDPVLSKMTLYGCPFPPRLSMKIYSESGLTLVVMLILGKSLGTETPLGIVIAIARTPYPPLLVRTTASECTAAYEEVGGAGSGFVVTTPAKLLASGR